MQFRIADTFTDSLAKLTGDEQKAVKTAAFDLQMNPAHPGLKLHPGRPGEGQGVDHHDAAYQWAERRRLERHPRTGAAQLVEIRETVREIQVPRYVEVDIAASTPGPRLAGRRRYGPRSSPTHRMTICWATACRSSG